MFPRAGVRVSQRSRFPHDLTDRALGNLQAVDFWVEWMRAEEPFLRRPFREAYRDRWPMLDFTTYVGRITFGSTSERGSGLGGYCE